MSYNGVTRIRISKRSCNIGCSKPYFVFLFDSSDLAKLWVVKNFNLFIHIARLKITIPLPVACNMYFLGNKYYREGRLYVNVYIYSWLKVILQAVQI